MPENINHEVFGELEFDYGWVKNIELNIFGEKRVLQIVIDADEDAEFEDAQLKSYEDFFSDIHRRIDEAEQAVFKYYQNESPNFRAQYDNEEDIKKFAPEISGKKELYNLVTPKQIMFPMVFDESQREAGFICDCSWEIEHGLGIKFENNVITEIGFQDILL